MTEDLVRRVDEFAENNLPWFDQDEDCSTCVGIPAQIVYNELVGYADKNNEEHTRLFADLEREAKRETETF